MFFHVKRKYTRPFPCRKIPLIFSCQKKKHTHSSLSKKIHTHFPISKKKTTFTSPCQKNMHKFFHVTKKIRNKNMQRSCQVQGKKIHKIRTCNQHVFFSCKKNTHTLFSCQKKNTHTFSMSNKNLQKIFYLK